MKLKLLPLVLLLGSALLYLGLFAVNGAFAQGCRAELISGPGGGIVDMFTGSQCSAVSNQCNNRLRQLRYQDPYFYRDAYCNVADYQRHLTPRHRSIPRSAHAQPVPQAHVTKSYDRCQAPGVVRCTQEWSDGRIVTEDYSCSGCRGYGNPAGDPCGWSCSFPQQ